MEKPICVVIGVGPKNGRAFAERFAKEGYVVALLSRSTDIAETVYHLATQRKSARSFEVDLRPFKENW